MNCAQSIVYLTHCLIKNYIIMKTNLLKVLMIAVITALPTVVMAQIVTAPTEDGYVSDADAITANNPYLWGYMKLGSSAVDGTGNLTTCIIPFQLPERPSGESVIDASLKVYVSYGRQWLNSNVDLYGLPYKKDTDNGGTGREIFTSDYYSGPYVTDHGTDVAIEDDYFTKNVDLGALDTPRWEETSTTGNTEIVAYLNAQYDAGAVAGDWVFLRLSIDNLDMTDSQYFKVEGGDSATPATLSISISGSTRISKVEIGLLNIYPNPVSSGSFTVQTSGLAGSLSIYSLTGELVTTQIVKGGSSQVNMQTDLPKGLYLVKLTDGNVVKTTKLRVQ